MIYVIMILAPLAAMACSVFVLINLVQFVMEIRQNIRKPQENL